MGQGHVYSAAIKPNRVIRQMMRDFADRMFDGEVIPMFQHLARMRKLSDDEIKELQTFLQDPGISVH